MCVVFFLSGVESPRSSEESDSKHILLEKSFCLLIDSFHYTRRNFMSCNTCAVWCFLPLVTRAPHSPSCTACLVSATILTLAHLYSLYRNVDMIFGHNQHFLLTNTHLWNNLFDVQLVLSWTTKLLSGNAPEWFASQQIAYYQLADLFL